MILLILLLILALSGLGEAGAEGEAEARIGLDLDEIRGLHFPRQLGAHQLGLLQIGVGQDQQDRVQADAGAGVGDAQALPHLDRELLDGFLGGDGPRLGGDVVHVLHGEQDQGEGHLMALQARHLLLEALLPGLRGRGHRPHTVLAGFEAPDELVHHRVGDAGGREAIVRS